MMPSIWPFARDHSSPASFEKALSKLSTQITSSTISLEKTRTRAHRSKAFWTLWSTLAYLVYTTLLALVVGPQQWHLPHYAGLAGAPAVIYAARKVLAVAFDWQISRQQGQVDRLVKERDEKIAQLKKATKYDSTQELLNKYGGSTPRSPSGEKQSAKRKAILSRAGGLQPQTHRTGITPPPTANIPGRSPPGRQADPGPSTPAEQGVAMNTPPQSSRNPRSSLSSATLYHSPNSDFLPDEPGFAPNAFPAPPPTSYAYSSEQQQHRWYDRILDVMLGEDETLAKNRLALICASCRLVNGQAAPGVRSLDEVGSWRCGRCGALNGAEKPEHGVGRMVQEMQMNGEKTSVVGGWTKVSRGDEDLPNSPGFSDTGRLRKDDNENEDDGNGDSDDSEDVGMDSRTSKSVPREAPDSAEERDSESGEAEKQADEFRSIGERVAKSKRAQKS